MKGSPSEVKEWIELDVDVAKTVEEWANIEVDVAKIVKEWMENGELEVY